MRVFFIISILFLSTLGLSQVAIIKDKDGFTNVRKQPSATSEVIYTIKEAEVFGYQKSKNNWVKVYISKNKYQLECGESSAITGYIHKSRLQPIENLKNYTGTRFSFQYNLNRFSLKNKVCDFDGEQLKKINGRRFYGTDGSIPKVEVTGITVSINEKTIDVPNVLYEDIFECNNKITINKNKGDYIVHHWNSDGAGAYLIVWVFGNHKVKQRLIIIP